MQAGLRGSVPECEVGMKPLEYFQQNHGEVAGWRQHLHAHPELLFDLHETSRFVADKLRTFGFDDVVEGIGGSGVVGTLRGTRQAGNHSIGLRADMDALPIEEESGVRHSSTNPGKMHACGHDGHTTMLLGAAEYLARHRDFAGTLSFIFQPAEEGGVGAQAMLDDGLVDRFGLSEVYGLHNSPGLPAGAFASRPDVLMASADSFEIKVTGVGGHASQPEKCIDPILAASHITVSLQSIVSRVVDPLKGLVITITRIHGGAADNIIPETVIMGGTVRALNEDVRTLAETRLCEIAQKTAAIHHARAEVTYHRGVPVTANCPENAGFAADAASKIVGHDKVDMGAQPVLGGEDFSYMLQQVPGAFMFIGNGDTAGLHNPAYDFNDDILPVGCAYWVELALARCSAQNSQVA